MSLEIYHQSGDALCEYLIYNPEGWKLYFTISGISEHYFEQAHSELYTIGNHIIGLAKKVRGWQIV